MDEADVLDSFCHLPEPARREFEEWIGKARDSEAHWRRINALVAAMKNAPLVEAQTDGEPMLGSQAQ